MHGAQSRRGSQGRSRDRLPGGHETVLTRGNAQDRRRWRGAGPAGRGRGVRGLCTYSYNFV